MIYKFTNRAKKVIEIANDISIELGHNYIGTEHILYGLVKEVRPMMHNMRSMLKIASVFNDETTTSNTQNNKIKENTNKPETNNKTTDSINTSTTSSIKTNTPNFFL